LLSLEGVLSAKEIKIINMSVTSRVIMRPEYVLLLDVQCSDVMNKFKQYEQVIDRTVSLWPNDFKSIEESIRIGGFTNA
jgi:hypothetical protein